jgi:hypothetical protein
VVSSGTGYGQATLIRPPATFSRQREKGQTIVYK